MMRNAKEGRRSGEPGVEREPPWPAVSWAETAWHGEVEHIPRSQRRYYAGNYRSAVVPRVCGLVADIDGETRALLDDATAEVTRFDAEMGREIAPLEAVLLRSESAASSQIEHLTASAKAVALAELGDTDRPNAELIVANSRSMMAAIELADRLDDAAIIEMHRVLMEKSNPEMVGHWRDQPVWIGTSSYGPQTASFVPPNHDAIPAAMDDLVEYLRRDDIAIIEHVAIAHAQFETIHPLPDGNGRTGRALAHAMFRGKGLTRNVTLPISAGLLANIDGYVDALSAYRAGDPVPIVERFAEAAHFATHRGRLLAADLAAIRTEWVEGIDARPQSSVWRVIDVVIRHGVVDAALLQRELAISDVTATDSISRLVAIGALEQIGMGRRNRRFEAKSVLDALDAFARSTRRYV